MVNRKLQEPLSPLGLVSRVL